MKRTTVMLPDDVAALLDLERRRRDVPLAQLIREAVEAYLGTSAKGPKRLPFIGIGHGTGEAVAENMETILEREWGGDDLAGGRSG